MTVKTFSQYDCTKSHHTEVILFNELTMLETWHLCLNPH